MKSNHFSLKPKRITKAILEDLTARGLLKVVTVPPKIQEAPNADCVETLYASDPKYGSHKMICVRKNQTEIRLTTHPENEEVILLHSSPTSFKPLYLVMALHHEDTLEAKAKEGLLCEDDFLALELEFNNPDTCYFTVIAGTPHCEVTLPGDAEAPIFFVTEPTDMTMKYTHLPETRFSLALPS